MDAHDKVRVLVLGGYGFFGRLLAGRLVLQPGVEVIVAGRSARKAEALARELACTSRVLDAQAADLAQRLVAIAPHVVVHTAGPFQGQGYDVARACIAAGVHYIDLADGRAFVAGITALDDAARAAGVAVLAGASSVPALSCAVADELAGGMQAVDAIDIGISPGNRTERGLSTVQAVLGYCGQPIAVAGQAGVHGWSGSWRHAYPAPVGTRLLSPCDVPDLELLPGRYPGARVRFGAGLELRALHRGMNAMAWLARRGFVRGWDRHAALLKRLSEWFRHAGSDAGAMHVTVRGRAGGGRPVVREWALVAAQGDGPCVPVLAAAALVARFARGEAPAAGARACIGLLQTAEILAQARGLAITAGECSTAGLFEQALGAAYQRLDAPVRVFHGLQGACELHGEVETEPPATALARLLAGLLGAPRVRAQGALRFELRCEPGQETWTRHFPGRRMRSRLRLRDGDLVESLGPVRLRMQLQEQDGELAMVLRGMRVLGVPCPAWLLPRVEAREHGGGGRLHFHVRASLPLVGQVAAYRGWLALPEAA